MTEIVKRKSAEPPVTYSRELVEEVVARMSEGETLVSICKDAGMPSLRVIYKWARLDKDGFGQVFKQARELQAHAVAEQVMQGARDATDASLGRLQMDAGKWFAAKLLPKVYSDRVAVDAQFSLEDNRSASDIAASVAARQARLMLSDDSE